MIIIIAFYQDLNMNQLLVKQTQTINTDQLIFKYLTAMKITKA
jgi:hypothetical protein